MIKVTVWNEYVHERKYEGIAKVYPKGIHGLTAGFSVAAYAIAWLVHTL